MKQTKNRQDEYLGIAEELIIGYEIIKDGWDRKKKGKRVRVIKKVKLLEVSLGDGLPKEWRGGDDERSFKDE